MAIAYLLPVPIISASHLLWTQISHMVTSGGCTVKGSGDGLAAYSATLSVFTATTPYASGANGFGNAKAWIRIQLGDGAQEVVIVNGAVSVSQLSAKWKVSLANRFVAGTPSATQAPSATDEQVPIGAGTDATPTYSVISAAEVRTGSLVGAAWDNTAPSAYGFWYAVLGASGSVPLYLHYRDPMIQPSASDPDPYMWSWFTNGAQSCASWQAIGTHDGIADGPKMWGRLGASWISIPGCVPFVNVAFNQVVDLAGSRAIDKKMVGYPIPYARHSALATPNGEKGISSLFQYKGVTTGLSGVIVSRTAPGDTIVVGDLLAQWGGAVVG